MPVRPIRFVPDPVLRETAQPVTAFDDALKALADDMLETMYDADGLGLAAPQIGLSARLIVLDPHAGRTDLGPAPKAMINPEITWFSEETETGNEGCLSIPDQRGEVTRPAAIKVKWQDVTGAEQEASVSGLEAVIIQHEVDHLNGKLFIDYLSSLKRNMIMRKMRKLARETSRDTGDED